MHILAQLLRESPVKHVFCLVRAKSREAAKTRVLSTLEAKRIALLNDEELSRVSFLPSDLGKASLGLDQDIMERILQSLTVVIHSAWAVNFNLGVRSFESQHIRGAHNLINLCLKTSTVHPARFYFCSSIAAAAGTPLPATIEECHIEDLSHAQKMGYARSKLVTEHVVKAAGEFTGITASVLRIGQIVGDSRHGMWNTTEAIPLMIQSVRTLGALPTLDEVSPSLLQSSPTYVLTRPQTPSWMPVDIIARAVVELSGVGKTGDIDPGNSAVYNVQNSKLFHWSQDLLPALKEAGLDFKTVPQREWVDLLRKSDPDPEVNPTIKLLEFFTEKYDNDRPARKGLVFVTSKAESESQSLRGGFDVIQSGLVGKMVDCWKTQW